MAIKAFDELQASLNAILGDRSDDDVLQFTEDFTDTFKDVQNKAADTTNWRAKYEENDTAWRQRYKDRFFNKPVEELDNDLQETEKIKKPLTYESLFSYPDK